jgi:hypothetical protein
MERVSLMTLKNILLMSLFFCSASSFAETPPVQPLPAPNVPPSSLPPAAVSGDSQPAGFYYYCASLKAYYPTVMNCPEPWIGIPLGSPSAAPDSKESEAASLEAKEAINSRKNSASLEIFGRALLYSLNFDRAISDHVTLGLGISSWDASAHWANYSAAITVLPFYANYYFSDSQSRGFISLGADLIKASQSGPNNETFENSGAAAVLGGGYEYRDLSGFLIRLGAYLIVGRSIDLNPSVSIGIAF